MFLDAAPYPWADPAASELHSVLADAYRTADDRLAVLATAGVPRRHLLYEGTPHSTWRQALDVAASMRLTHAVVDTVLKDDSVVGFHDKIRKLLSSEVPADARPVAVDWNAGWGALRLDKPTSRAPLALGSARQVNAGDPVIIVQHAMGGYKQFVIEPQGIVSLTDHSLRYQADTTGGSSGAPVFDQSMRVIAVHFRARPDDKVNEGARIDLVKTGLRQHGLNFVEAVFAADPIVETDVEAPPVFASLVATSSDTGVVAGDTNLDTPIDIPPNPGPTVHKSRK